MSGGKPPALKWFRKKTVVIYRERETERERDGARQSEGGRGEEAGRSRDW